MTDDIKDTKPLRDISIRLVQDEAELHAAQNLRYKVFYEEFSAIPSEEMTRLERDFDEYDPVADHLIVTDKRDGEEVIVGTYRLMTQDKAKQHGKFYTSSEFNLQKLMDSGLSIMELGRSCVMPNYRAGSVLQLLWQGIADYVSENNIDIMFGCASLHSTDIEALAQPLSYMYHNHLASEDIRPKALADRYIDMNILPPDQINVKAVFSDLPPLIKGYLRVGASIGDGAVIDPQFNTTDVCIVAHTHYVTGRYRKHYERKIDKEIPSGSKLLDLDANGLAALAKGTA